MNLLLNLNKFNERSLDMALYAFTLKLIVILVFIMIIGYYIAGVVNIARRHDDE